eukprot:scaffold348451_cov45-Prasinocladus_malaysianus.AAC.2
MVPPRLETESCLAHVLGKTIFKSSSHISSNGDIDTNDQRNVFAGNSFTSLEEESRLVASIGANQFCRGFAKGSKGGKKAQTAATQEQAGAPTQTFDLKDAQNDIDAAVEHLSHELANIRSGRATPEMLDFIQVEAYGERAPLKGLAAVSVRDPRLLSLSVYDPSVIDNVIKAIRDSPLKLNPTREGKGQEISVPVPPPTQDTIKALEKLVYKAGEDTK